MEWEGENKAEIERQLRAALEQARRAYAEALEQSRAATELAADASLQSPDSTQASGLRARKDGASRRMFDRYRQALARFTEFTLTGKPPKDFKPS
ncbi:MAG TPA: hypothetical protein VMB03_16930 [Bryobacteraceae bacterium]|nr:hypothetical protein [Bryobacteraceae bacterium]